MAYLLALAEAQRNNPVYGRVWMEQVWVAFTTPDELRSLLPRSLRSRFDYWLARGPRTSDGDQLDMFD